MKFTSERYIMKKIIRDPEVYVILGLLGTIVVTPSKKAYVNSILIPMFFLMQIIGLIFMIKNYKNEKKQ